MQKYRILVIGAGIAGAAAAALLGRGGHEVTVVERSAGIRSSGSPVDVRAEGLAAVRMLDVEKELRARDTGVRRLAFVDHSGKVITTIGTRAASEDIEISRTDLAQVLTDTAKKSADFRFADTFVSLSTDDFGVDVTFAGGTRARFDVVVGADGQHSATRRALWDTDGTPSTRITPMDLAIATAPLPLAIADPRTVEMYNEPGVALAAHPAGGLPGAAFIFRTTSAPASREEQIDLLRARYASTGWRVAEFLAALEGAEDMFFDNVLRVSASSWSWGRVVLLGDAASSLTILGNGSSAALMAAHNLDLALSETDEVLTGLAQYEQRTRPLVVRGQRGAGFGANFLVPKSATGIHLRNLAARMLRTI